MSEHNPRTYEVPEALVAAGYGPVVDLDVLDREVEFPGPFGEWAEKVLFTENTRTLHEACGDMRLLPRGILASVQLDDESVIISGLIDADNRIWDKRYNAWVPPEAGSNETVETTILDDDEVAYVIRALREGADEVWFRPYIPKAFVAAPAPPIDPAGKKSESDPAAEEIPPGSAIIAVVDPIDEDAVLEMLAVTPGPRVLRRHNGNWFNDPEWVDVLKSVKPPKIVKLDEAQVASITSQVDRTTADQDWEAFDADSREQYQIFTASGAAVSRSPYLQNLQNEADERALFALIAVAGRELSPKDVKNTEQLKRYWTVGRGAAKIRWGTPGSWRRCYRHLVKYVGPKIAPGYCTNLSMRLGGPGIATHVGKVKPIPGKGLPGSADVEPYKSGDAWDIQGHKIVIDPEGIGETWYSHPDGSIGDPACLGSAENTVWVRDPSTNDEMWRVCPEHGDSCEDGAYASVCQQGDCGWTNFYVGYGAHPLEVDGEIPAPVTAANPSGVNGYDRGMTFEQSTKGVERDFHGRFAAEGGSNRSERAKRRKSSMARHKKAREEKEKGGSSKSNAAAEKAQREDLAAMSLQIAQLRAQGKDLEAAQMRVEYCRKALSYAETPTKRLNAQAALVNAQTALARAIKAKRDREAREREQANKKGPAAKADPLYTKLLKDRQS